MFTKREQISNHWFFSNPHPLFKLCGIYVKGDSLILAPFLILLVALLVFSLPIGLLALGLFIAVRGLGEMVYWLHQQFGPKTYRPWDYGLKNLNNESVYIIYQLIAQLQIVAGLTLVIYLITK